MFNLFKKPPSDASEQVMTWAVAHARHSFPERFEAPEHTQPARQARFEAIALYMALALWYLHQCSDNQARHMAQAVTDNMFDSFDIALREQGVADLRVGKEVRKLASAFNGRLQSYTAALDNHDVAALSAALTRNQVCEAAPAMALAIGVVAESKSLQNMNYDQWLAHIARPLPGRYEPQPLTGEDPLS